MNMMFTKPYELFNFCYYFGNSACRQARYSHCGLHAIAFTAFTMPRIKITYEAFTLSQAVKVWLLSTSPQLMNSDKKD